MKRIARPLLAASLLALAGAGALPAAAQQVFRIVGPDGRVTFSDTPPTNANVKVQSGAAGSGIGAAPSAPAAGSGGASAAAAGASVQLPFALRNVVSRYPVVFYSGANCGPCDAGRSHLRNRGVPFTEKTITTSEDIEALQRLSGARSVPILTIGGQQLRGFSEVEWDQYLDVAGYSKTSQLPPGYRASPPTALAPLPERAPEPATAAAPPAPAQTPSTTPSGPSPSNPAGIQF